MKRMNSLIFSGLILFNLQSPVFGADSKQTWWQSVQNYFGSLWDRARSNPYLTAAGFAATVVGSYCVYKLGNKIITDQQCKQDEQYKKMLQDDNTRSGIKSMIGKAIKALYSHQQVTSGTDYYFNELKKLYAPGKKASGQIKQLEKLELGDYPSGNSIFANYPQRLQFLALQEYPEEIKNTIQDTISELADQWQQDQAQHFFGQNQQLSPLLKSIAYYLSEPYQYMNTLESYQALYSEKNTQSPEDQISNIILTNLDSQLEKYKMTQISNRMAGQQLTDRLDSYDRLIRSEFFKPALQKNLKSIINGYVQKGNEVSTQTAIDILNEIRGKDLYKEVLKKINAQSSLQDIESAQQQLTPLAQQTLDGFTYFPSNLPDQYKNQYKKILLNKINAFIRRDINQKKHPNLYR